MVGTVQRVLECHQFEWKSFATIRMPSCVVRLRLGQSAGPIRHGYTTCHGGRIAKAVSPTLSGISGSLATDRHCRSEERRVGKDCGAAGALGGARGDSV